MLDLLLTTLDTLRAHALRFVLTSLGIVWGAFMLTFLTASMQGFNDHFTTELEEAGPKIVIVFPGHLLKNRVGERGARAVELDNDDVARLAALHSIEEVAPDISMWSQIVRAGGRTKLFNVIGINANSSQIRNLVPEHGRFVSPLDVERGARVAYLGPVAAERLFGRASPLGRTLQIESIRFRVIGVGRAKKDQIIGIHGWDDWSVFIPYTTAQRWFVKSDQVEELVFAPVSRERSWEAIGHTRQILGLHHDFLPDLDTAVTFFNVHDVLQIIHTIFLGEQLFLISAGIITLLVGAVGVMNIMLVVVGERTAEIGLRKAVGARSRTIFIQFLAEAGAVCGLSALLGASLGATLSRVVTALAPPDGPFSSPPSLEPFQLAIIVVALIGVGLVAGVVPAIRAARIPPAEALRAS